jgi:hypothetical protein
MFFTIRQTCALFQSFVTCPTRRKIHMSFQSLLAQAAPIEFPGNDDYLASDDPKLWKDYTAVGFDISGEFLCLTKNDCYE